MSENSRVTFRKDSSDPQLRRIRSELNRSEITLIPEIIREGKRIIETVPTTLGSGLPTIELRTLVSNHHRLTLEEAILIKQQLAHAFSYIYDITDHEVQCSPQFSIDIIETETRLGASGSLIRIPRSYLETSQASEEGWLEMQTGLVHETVHNFTDDEALPMLAELIHYLDTNNFKRLEYILSIYGHPDLDEAYTKGFHQIADWLRRRPEDLKEVFVQDRVEILKAIFKNRLLDHIQTDKT